MKNLLKKVKDNKIKIASGALSIASFIVSIAAGAVESKQLEQTVDQAVDAKIASIINETDEEIEKVEEAQNE